MFCANVTKEAEGDALHGYVDVIVLVAQVTREVLRIRVNDCICSPSKFFTIGNPGKLDTS